MNDFKDIKTVQEEELLRMATKKAVKLKAFYTHAFIYSIGVAVYVLKEYLGFPLNFFPLQYINCFVMFIWTTAFLISAVDIWATHKLLGPKWEARKMKSIMEKKSSNQKWE
jgi:hypothetical protein